MHSENWGFTAVFMTHSLSVYSNSQQKYPAPTWLHCCFSHVVSFMAVKRLAWRSLCMKVLLSNHKKIDQWHPPFSKTSTHSFTCFCLFIKLFSSVCLNYILLYQILLMHIHFPLALCEYSVLALRSPCRWVNLCRLIIVVAQFVCCYVCLPLSNACVQPNVSVTYFIIDSNQHQRQTRPWQMAAPCSLALFVWEALSSTC